MTVCPVIDPLRPPSLPRDLPGVLQYAATCLPGTATASGCAPNQMFYAVLIPWADVISDTPRVGRAWTAPGGNRYWASETPESSPAGLAILRLMADQSRKHFQHMFGGGRNAPDYDGRRMGEVISSYAGKLALDEGIVHVEKRPDPNETAGNFVRRGGYMLWVDPATGPFRSKHALDWYHPPWLGGDVTNIYLYGFYDPGTKTVQYSIRVDMKDTWRKVAEKSTGWIADATAKFCSTITSEDATKAAYASMLYPGAQAYSAGWNAAVQTCGLNMMPCTPREGQPQPPAPPVSATGGWKSTHTASAGGAAHVLTAAVTQGSYPPGSIAYVDPTAQLVHIAFPQPGKGTTHAPQTAHPFVNGAPRVPSTLFQVTREQWERATLPWARRRSTKIGAIGVAVIGAVATTATIITRNQH